MRQPDDPGDTVLEVRGLTKHFPVGRTGGVLGIGGRRHVLHAVDDASFTLRRGKILALVGESGSGKSTIARLLALLHPPTAGTMYLDGKDVLALRGRAQLLWYRSRVQMIFQDPYGSLNPVKTVAHHIMEVLKVHQANRTTKGEMRDVVHELLQRVGLTPPEDIARKYPPQLSGGQRQRVSFARALATSPEVVVADEPISMLDVSLRMGVLNLMDDLRRAERGLSYLYITHDLASARYLADDTMVLYAGHVVELGPSAEVMDEPLHPYTRLLLGAVPDPTRRLDEGPMGEPGEVRGAIDPRPACRFADRCPSVMDICRQATPALVGVRPGRAVRCYLHHRVSEPPAM